MSREHKFRVWDKITNQYLQELGIYYWHIPYSLDGEKITGEANLFGLSELLRRDNFVAQQYTGLKDKNGKEIFEGDIVKYTTWTGSYDGTTEQHQTQVQFKDGAYYPRYINDECEDSWYSFKVYDLEIIGNIFETPHLDENK
jgi:uncharacterized phage protein (TIGR01671 family)